MAGLPWPISQQWQDSHLENIWVSSRLFNACVYDCIETELLPEGRMMVVLDSWTTRNTPGLKQVGLVGHLWTADHYPDPKILVTTMMITRTIGITMEIIPDKMSCLGTDHHYPAPRTQVAKIMGVLRKQPHLLRVSVFTLSDPGPFYLASSWLLRIPCVF